MHHTLGSYTLFWDRHRTEGVGCDVVLLQFSHAVFRPIHQSYNSQRRLSCLSTVIGPSVSSFVSLHRETASFVTTRIIANLSTSASAQR